MYRKALDVDVRRKELVQPDAASLSLSGRVCLRLRQSWGAHRCGQAALRCVRKALFHVSVLSGD